MNAGDTPGGALAVGDLVVVDGVEGVARIDAIDDGGGGDDGDGSVRVLCYADGRFQQVARARVTPCPPGTAAAPSTNAGRPPDQGA